MSDLHDLTATEQAEAVRMKEVAPTELVEHYLARIDRFDHRLGAFLTVTADLALDGARAATTHLANSDPRDIPLLFGVPTAVKDLVNTAGVTTTYGSAALHDYVPSADSHVVGLMKAAGMISLGKTNIPEVGAGCYTSNFLAPDARTPWDETRSAAGSSGGSGAAVAAGLVAIAHASDAGGSTRTPAASCGLVGMKPSRGIMSMAPKLNWMANLSDGPLARSVPDAAAFLEVTTAACPGDPLHRPLPRRSYMRALDKAPGPLRVARSCQHAGGYPVHSEIVDAYEQTSKLLAELGHEVIDIDPPDQAVFEAMVDGFTTTIAAGMAAFVDTMIPADRRHLLQPGTIWWAEMGRRVKATDLLAGQAIVMSAAFATLQNLEPYDVLLSPTTTDLPVALDWFKLDDPVEVNRRMVQWSAFTPTYNITGQPAIVLPLGRSSDDLPIGLQFVGRRWEDDRLISLAWQLEQAAPWRDRHPSLWAE